MSQVASPRDPLQHIFAHVLQPDERLLWSDYPQLRKLRFPLFSKEGIFDLLFSGIVALLLAALAYGIHALSEHQWARLRMYIGLFLVIFGVSCLTTFLRTFTAVLKKAPPYWRYTRYALTDHRALIIVCLPYTEPTLLEYFPHEMTLLTSRVRPDGSGILAFGVLRHVKVGRYGRDVAFPGSFLGISHVQEVMALFQHLKSTSEPLAQDLGNRG